ncbi:neural cell adhesion molecule 1a [Brachionichthys hirsutus]|uniref:neural cell adhesion molecule 1a n=1 Tax=Brachionichthys hirsutus TaxID=412623 RepID=UPI003604D6E1
MEAAIQVQITPPFGEISVGDSKFFLCEVVGDAKEIDWYDPSGEKILPSRPDIFVSRSDESTSVLTIYHATVDSAGIYKCLAKNGDTEAQATVQVTLFQKITFKNAPSPQEFSEGDDADIICEVFSSPPPVIIWKHKGAKIQAHKDVRYRMADGYLQIRGIKKTDEGTYTCEARVMARGEIDLRAIKVIVNVLPSIRARQSDVNATADVGNAALLACDADGFPEPVVTWARNNVVLEAGDKYSLNDDGSELLIKDVRKVDEGDYVCIARNKAGEKVEEVGLNVFVQPTITYMNNQTASEFDEHVTLTCEASGDPTPTISWSFDNRPFSEGEQASWTRPDKYENIDRNIVVRSHARVSSLTLKYVRFTYAGQYLCTATNSIGQDNQFIFLEVRYVPKVLGPVAWYTWEGNPANITCEVQAHPGASVVWLRDGLELPSTNSSNIKIYNTGTISYLEVTPDSQSDFGSYNCTAVNMMGKESREFLLIEADVPESPQMWLVLPFSSTAEVHFREPESTGGAPVIKYKVEWRLPQRDWRAVEYKAEDAKEKITIARLKPETTYEVKMSAINGKGESESTSVKTFKTEPVRKYRPFLPTSFPPTIAATSMTSKGEPSAPKLEVKGPHMGNSIKVNWIKQDDGGSPITHYLVRYKARGVSDWKPEIRLPSRSEYVVLNGLDWNTDYEVHVVAENQQGKSEPGTLSVRTATEPTTVPGTGDGDSGLSTGAIVGILIVVFFLLLVAVDVTCYFLNKCGLLMCIAVNFCGKAGPGAKSKDMEEGNAAFTKDESKEPIVEVRTEEESAPNQGGGPTEPNETTPLTEPEPAAADGAFTVVNRFPSTATNLVAESFSTAQTTSDRYSPKNNPTALKSNTKPDVGPLVDLSDTPKAPSLSNPTSSEPVSPASDNADCGAVKVPDTTQSNDFQVDGPTKDASNALCTDSTTPAQNDGKTLTDNNTKAETEGKAATDEVKTVPNEAPQMNGNESKA